MTGCTKKIFDQGSSGRMERDVTIFTTLPLYMQVHDPFAHVHIFDPQIRNLKPSGAVIGGDGQYCPIAFVFDAISMWRI